MLAVRPLQVEGFGESQRSKSELTVEASYIESIVLPKAVNHAPCRFNELLDQIAQLTPEQRRRLIRHLIGKEVDSVPSCPAQLPTAAACPNCGVAADQLESWGQSHVLRRYRCRDCGRTFNALTGTALAHLRKHEQWARYAELLVEGVSLHEAARSCQIDRNTAFRWRHRFLRDAAGHRVEHEAGIVEADKTFFLESFKGQRSLTRPARHRGGVAGKRGLSAEQTSVLVVCDRSWQTANFKLEKLDAAHVIAALRPLVDQEAILCPDSAGIYTAFAGAPGITRRPLNIQHGPRIIDGVFLVQNVNAYDSRLKGWMRRFHGVTTQYLENHLGWRRMLERYKTMITPKLCLAEATVRPIYS